jgi:uncharacterized protein
MLIRFIVENIFSFGDRKEFTTIPNSKLKTLNDHKFNETEFPILKLSSIYGANGAGKSNLVHALMLLQQLAVNDEIQFRLNDSQFKFNNGKNKKQVLAIEFIQDHHAFYYALELFEGKVSTEELYTSGLGKVADELIYERKTSTNGHSTIKFNEDFENDAKSQILKAVLLEEFVKPNEPILRLLSNRDNKYFDNVKKAFSWFKETLQIITPNSKSIALAHRIDIDKSFKAYAEEMMQALNLGIDSLSSDQKRIEHFFIDADQFELEELKRKIEASPKNVTTSVVNNGEELIFVKEDGQIWVKTLKLGHSGKGHKVVKFDLDEESDGTVRLLDLIPAFKSAVSEKKVFIIDEIERSIHPLLIKELVRKFSEDTNTNGQIIFTTHESNLLDQDFFRQDEIWFVEKNKSGSSDLYSLSDFKEHKTIDIEKGYLNGRYGSIPFLGNLQELNWQKYDYKK